MAYKVFKYRLYPTETQRRRMQHFINVCCAWYNMCLEERKLAYELEGRRVSKHDQYKNIALYRKSIPLAANVPVTVLRAAAQDLDEAFQAFFRRAKAGETPGYPKFRSRRFANSFGTTQADSFGIKGRRFYFQNIGRIAIRWHRPYEGTIKLVRVVREAGDKWFVCLTCEVPDPQPLPQTGREVGIDFGINALITLSDGARVENPKWYRAAQDDLRLLQRKFARAEKGSNNWKALKKQVQRLQWHIANQRRDFWNKIVHELVTHYDLIAVEDLQINNMARNKHLSKSILDAGWGYAKLRLESKALETGAKVIFVDPRNTSNSCSNCGHKFEKFGLSTRWVDCPDCGLSLDRDHNAAIAVLKRAGHARSDIT